MTLTAAQRATLESRLTEAEDALHRLSIGAQAVRVSTEGESVDYTPAMRPALAAYIAQLKRQLGQTARAGAIAVRFR